MKENMNNAPVPGMPPQEMEQFNELLSKMIAARSAQGDNVNEQEFLASCIQAEQPELDHETVAKIASDIVEGVETFNENMSSINHAAAEGKNAEKWFADKVGEAAVGVSAIELSQTLQRAQEAIDFANEFNIQQFEDNTMALDSNAYRYKLSELAKQEKYHGNIPEFAETQEYVDVNPKTLKVERRADTWNDRPLVDTKAVALEVGKKAGQMGLTAAAIAGGVSIVEQLVSDKKIDIQQVLMTSVKTGADAGIKYSLAAALQIASSKGILNMLPMGTPAWMIANIACMIVEDVKIISKVASGELTIAQGINQISRTAVAMTAGAFCSTVGAATLSFIPFVGPVLGGMLGYMVGSTIGGKVLDVLTQMRTRIQTMLKTTIKEKLGTTRKSSIVVH